MKYAHILYPWLRCLTRWVGATTIATLTLNSPALQPRPLGLALHQGEIFRDLCWITYSPSTFNPTLSPPQWPQEEAIRADLAVLYAHGVRGLVTYRAFFHGSNSPPGSAPPQTQAEAPNLPHIAQTLGFQGLILGVWDPRSEAELAAAEAAAPWEIVLGYTVGNEGLDRRYDRATLRQALDRLRRTTGKPATTTEEIGDYFQQPDLRHMGDWLFPNAHPYFAGIRQPQAAAQWTAQRYHQLQALSDRPVVFKEVGLPTAGDPQATESHQAAYYTALQATGIPYVHFAGFDLPWKRRQNPDPLSTGDPEPHWGLFRSDRQPKLAAQHLCSADP